MALDQWPGTSHVQICSHKNRQTVFRDGAFVDLGTIEAVTD
jgi:hypothetical protein